METIISNIINEKKELAKLKDLSQALDLVYYQMVTEEEATRPVAKVPTEDKYLGSDASDTAWAWGERT